MRARTLYSTIRGILVGALLHGVTSPPEGGAEARVETLAGGAASPPSPEVDHRRPSLPGSIECHLFVGHSARSALLLLGLRSLRTAMVRGRTYGHTAIRTGTETFAHHTLALRHSDVDRA